MGKIAIFVWFWHFMLICIMCHFFRSESDHDECGINLKLPTVWVHSCVVLLVLVVAMATGTKFVIYIFVIFVICVIPKQSAIYPQWTHLRASVRLVITSLFFSWSIPDNFIWLRHFGSKLHSFEGEDNANAESIPNMAWIKFYQITVRSWKMLYQIEGLNRGS